MINSLEKFLKGIQEKKNYPQGLQLKLSRNRLGDEGVQALATALQSSHCPQGLQLHFTENQLGDKSAKVLAVALQSGQCPQELWLNLSFNQIGNEGAKALATALQSGHCPQGLRLDLDGNNITAEADVFLKEELGTLQPGQFVPSPIIASLCKYHVISNNKVQENPKQPGSFQLSEYHSVKTDLGKRKK